MFKTSWHTDKPVVFGTPGRVELVFPPCSLHIKFYFISLNAIAHSDYAHIVFVVMLDFYGIVLNDGLLFEGLKAGCRTAVYFLRLFFLRFLTEMDAGRFPLELLQNVVFPLVATTRF